VGRAWLRGDANAGADARFLVRHRFGAHDLDGYRGWFRAGRGRLCGEITPAYSTLDDERIALIREAFPDLRLLFVMRDPIDRAWSAAYKSLVRDRGRAAAEVTREEWERKLGSRGLALRSDYLGTLERWGRHFPGERIWAGFFEDLVADPDDFVARIARFLGVDPPPPVPGSGRARNASGRSDCPPEFERLLAARFVDMNRQLHERYGSHATSWYHRTLRVLDREVGDRAATARQPI
jgi:hypothetical protein